MKPRLRFPAAIVLTASSIVGSALFGQVHPRLTIESTDTGHVVVEWPIGDGLFALQELGSFDGGDEWQPANVAPQLLSPNFRLLVDPADHTRFFRLYPISQPEPGIVPRPETLAPPPPINAQASFADSTAFLYSSPNSVQIGVGPGTILAQRASVLRGQVKKRDGAPLAGVHVHVLHHPEFGFTYTRADGMFDLAVNGGPLYTVNFQSRGYCPAQRQVQAPVQDFRCLEDVILVGMDPIATSVTFGTNALLQVAKSSVNTDKAGSRSATVLFPPGTCATLEMPDGSTLECQGLTIRATEFTVGPNGLQAMPGVLPPTSAYTYAVELNADEAVAMGANTIRFNQSVQVYVDNFLNLPTGALMPSAYYDRQLSAWVPQENGVVIRVLGTSGGLAQVDVDGDGVEETTADLNALAFTTAELQQLAVNYAPGKTLWRMPVEHFTAMDFNCPTDPAERDKPNTPGDGPSKDACLDCDYVGGNVGIAQQGFHETIPLVGVSMDLHYSSVRVPGHRVDAGLHLPLIGDTVPEGLLKVRVDMDVAGRLSEFEFPARKDQTEDFAWDGFDAYGRLLNDTQRAHFRLLYFYPQVYGGHPGYRRAMQLALPLFGNYGQFTSTIGHNEVGQAVAINFDRLLTIPDHRKAGMGGWSLTPHHRYDPVGKILYLGDGTVRRPGSLANGVSVIELDPTFNAQNVAAASDGSLFVTQRGGRVYRMAASGTLTPITAALGPSGEVLPGTIQVSQGDFTAADGQPAAQVLFNQISWHDLATGPDDSLYLRTFWTIVRITPDGILRVVIGRTGSESFPPDGSVARNPGVSASAIGNAFIAVGPDHTVYFNDQWNFSGQTRDYVRKISPDGRISTLIGPAGRAAGPFDTQFFTEGPAIEVKTAPISGLDIAPDGSVYVAGGIGMVRINSGGTVAYVVNGAAISGENNPDTRFSSEGKLANSPTPLRLGGAEYVNRLQIGPDGLPYFYYPHGPGFIWKVDSGGLFQRVAGRWGGIFEGAANPLAVQIGDLRDFTIDRSGTLTMLSQPPGGGGGGGSYSLRRLGLAFPGFDAAELRVAARDGSELYIFNANGLHLRTLNPLTGATNWLFTYDSNNLVTQLRDRHGLVTHIERTGSGTPTAIVGPYGQRTVLTVDENGFLESVVNPANEAVVLASSASGLLLSLTTPRGNTEHLAYDALGRAVHAQDAAGNTRLWTRTGQTDVFTVSHQAPSGTSKEVRLELLTNGDTRIDRKFEDGTTNTETYSRLGDRALTDRDGSVITSKVTHDPLFPGQTRVLGSMTVNLPGGLMSSSAITRSVTLANANHPLSAADATGEMTINGSSYTSHYNASNRTAVVTTPEGRRSVAILDEQGRKIRGQSGRFNPVDIVYDSAGRIASVIDQRAAGPRQIDFTYDSLGRLAHVVEPLGRTNSLAYDAAGRPTDSIAPNGSVVSVSYDADSNVTSITPPGRPPHRFTYDSVGSLTKYTPPAVGPSDDSVSYHYDADQRPTRIDLPDGQAVVFNYGAKSQLNQLVLGSGPTLIFNYNSAAGQLTNISSSTGEGLTYAYQGPIITDTIWSGIVTGNASVQFNADFLPIRQTINGKSSIDFAYDRDGLVVKAGNMILTRDPDNGAVTSNKLGVVTDKRDFSENGLLTNFIASVSDVPIWTYSLLYDALDRITNKVESLNGTTRTFGYVYDSVGRLVQVWQNGTLATTYTYDANGNRLSRNSEAGVYDTQDRAVSYHGASFAYSPNGTLRSKMLGAQSTAYVYDLRGALTSVTLPSGQVIEYLIDPTGERIGKKVDGTLYHGWLYAGALPVAELDGRSEIQSHFVYADDGTTPSMIAMEAQTFRVLSDERGSVRFVIDTVNGAVVQELDYDEFGRVLVDTNPNFQPFGFAGGVYDPATGLTRFGARDYDAEIGKWTSSDPIGFAGGDANLYAYAANDPINWMDPSGLSTVLERLARRYKKKNEHIIAEELLRLNAAYERYGKLQTAYWGSDWGQPECSGTTSDLLKRLPTMANLKEVRLVRWGVGANPQNVFGKGPQDMSYVHQATGVMVGNEVIAVLDPITGPWVNTYGLAGHQGVVRNFNQQFYADQWKSRGEANWGSGVGEFTGSFGPTRKNNPATCPCAK